MQWCPLGALGGPSLPSASLQGDFRGTFPGWRNPSGSWIEMQVGVVAKEPKAPQAHVFSLICQVNLSCVWMGGVYLSWVRSLSSRNGLSCRTRGSRSHSRYSSRCPQSGGPGSGLLASNLNKEQGLFDIFKKCCILFPGGASVKEPICQCRRCKRPRFDLWVGQMPWRRAWQPTHFLAWRKP